MKTKFNRQNSARSISNLIFHPLGILGISLASGVLFALYVMYRTDGLVRSWLIWYFMPVGVVFVSFILDRLNELGQTSVQWLILDLIVVLLSLARAVTYIPFYSGHALLLSFTLLSSRSRIAKILALIVLIQVVYLKLFRWNDWVTLFGGLLVGFVAGYYRTTRINQKLLKPIISWTPALYDRLSKHYDRFAKWLFPIGDKGRDQVVSGLDSGFLLDIACGTGVLLKKAHQVGLHGIGIDTSRGMLLETKKKIPAAEVVQASFYALPFAKDQFDFVVETNAVSGADIDAKSVLREMLRVCADGGELRLGDYGKSGRTGLWIQFLEMLGILLGDYPYDYKDLLSILGHEAEIKNLGWGGMYQFVRVLKKAEG